MKRSGKFLCIGATIASLAALSVADAVAQLVKYRGPVEPRPEWAAAYRAGLEAFERRLAG